MTATIPDAWWRRREGIRHIDSEVSTMLRTVRVHRRLRQKDLARLVPCHETTIQRLEAGNRAPSRILAGRIADALQLDTEQRALLLTVAVDHAGWSSPYRTGKVPSGTASDAARRVRDHYDRNTGTGMYA